MTTLTDLITRLHTEHPWLFISILGSALLLWLTRNKDTKKRDPRTETDRHNQHTNTTTSGLRQVTLDEFQSSLDYFQKVSTTKKKHPDGNDISREIASCESALKARRLDPEKRYDIQHELAQLYGDVFIRNADISYLDKSRALYEEILATIKRSGDLEKIANTRFNLADALEKAGTVNDDSKSLLLALNYYEQVLEIWDSERYPFEWTMANQTLGKLLNTLGEWSQDSTQKASYYRQSVQAYEKSQTVLSDDSVQTEIEKINNKLTQSTQ